MLLTTEEESQKRKEKRITALVIVILIAVPVLFIGLGLYAYQEDHSFKSNQLSYAITRKAERDVPNKWLYLAAMDTPDIAPNGSYWIPMFAISRDKEGAFLVACIMMDVSLMHGKYPDSKRQGVPHISEVPTSLVEKMATRPDSPDIVKSLARLPCGEGRLSSKHFYKTKLAGIPNPWRVGSRNFQQTAKALIREKY